MVIADYVGERDLSERHRLWPFVESWAAELGLTGSDAIDQASQPGTLRQQYDRERERRDPEAGQ
jgi:hypothetical protein